MMKSFLLQVIEEEINRVLYEQAPAPPAPPAVPTTPPADPEAPEGAEETPPPEEEDAGKSVEDTIQTLAAKTTVDIKKTILAGLQDGSTKDETEELIANVNGDGEAPENIKRVVHYLQKSFNVKVPEEPSVAPVKESQLQTSVREYLLYKRLLREGQQPR